MNSHWAEAHRRTPDVKGKRKALAFSMASSSAGVLCSWLRVENIGYIVGVRDKH